MLYYGLFLAEFGTALTTILPEKNAFMLPNLNKGNNKLPNSEQSYKGKLKTHKYINRQNQSTTGKL
jgi:hypothetical protein